MINHFFQHTHRHTWISSADRLPFVIKSWINSFNRSSSSRRYCNAVRISDISFEWSIPGWNAKENKSTESLPSACTWLGISLIISRTGAGTAESYDENQVINMIEIHPLQCYRFVYHWNSSNNAFETIFNRLKFSIEIDISFEFISDYVHALQK